MRAALPLVLGFCLVLGACAETPVRLTEAAGAMVPVGVPDAAPASFVATCARAPSLCDASASAAAGVDRLASGPPTPAETAAASAQGAGLADGARDGAAAPAPQPTDPGFDDRAALRLLQTVNNEVNGSMLPDTRLLVNVADDWSPATPTVRGFVGDCKSFAAEKRRRLLAAGFPADRLFYAVVFREDLGLHALLMAHLDGGDYALDSRGPWVMRWYEAPYTYVQRQIAGDPMHWANLVMSRPAAAPILLAESRTAAATPGAGSR